MDPGEAAGLPLAGMTALQGLRDRAYDFIGERRYRWFGRYKACWLPKDTEKRKFLDLEDPVYQDAPHGNQAENDPGPDRRQGNP